MKTARILMLAGVFAASAALPAFAQVTTPNTQTGPCPTVGASTSASATGNTSTGSGPGSAASGGTEGQGTAANGTGNDCPTTVLPNGSPNTGGNNNSNKADPNGNSSGNGT